MDVDVELMPLGEVIYSVETYILTPHAIRRFAGDFDPCSPVPDALLHAICTKLRRNAMVREDGTRVNLPWDPDVECKIRRVGPLSLPPQNGEFLLALRGCLREINTNTGTMKIELELFLLDRGGQVVLKEDVMLPLPKRRSKL